MCHTGHDIWRPVDYPMFEDKDTASQSPSLAEEALRDDEDAGQEADD